ncbi:NAD(P)-dependent dehydrogenase (short-subunit alcohol dehydrogenase family) [Nocardia transvalensis]|uniref:NAD(P)-dependent dehydrogenase (Short-subunit alcohol dehydrogenase family) n=1 Tax=Nocardia transvalensis TaxID=37333 RepID=A0A7W9PE34_9NOCA|nr:SDR family NAD(P)-dependent oxidoreductase [Nocardia transvalensis]MBB5914424.1 NAD(P)-dependent dehydrogenase (short-subunit alcohol dehydrogenase family) [Nocardia transvalensis]
MTGAASGFGYAMSRAVAAAGGRVVATARRPERAQSLRELAAAHPDRVLVLPLDVTDGEQAERAVAEAVNVFGRLDVVVNNAGYGIFGALEEISDDAVRKVFETNVFGSLNVIRAALPTLREQRSGHIVQISSVAGVTAPSPGLGLYAATKFTVEGMCEGLAKEVAHLGIGVTIVEPGMFGTNFVASLDITPTQHPDYAASVEAAHQRLTHLDPSAYGDPDHAAHQIVTAVESSTPPLRLPLGQDAITAIRTKLIDHLAEIDDQHPAVAAAS